MAKRFIDSDFFKKPLIRGLQGPYKLLLVYLFCECNHAGIWDVELDVASMRLGKKYNSNKILEVLNGSIIEFDNGEKWFMPDFIEFQYGPELNSDNRVHLSVLTLLEKHNLKQFLENKPLISPLQRAKDKDKDKDKDKSKEKFTKPTVEQVKEYAIEKSFKRLIDEPQSFIDFYDTNGWVQGRSGKLVKDWKACIRTWIRGDKQGKTSKPKWDQTKHRSSDEHASRSNVTYVEPSSDAEMDRIMAEIKAEREAGK